MIDEARTLELFGYTSDELGKWSKKPIAVVCEKCGKHRTCRNDMYRDLCIRCAQIGNTSKRGSVVSDEGRRNMQRAAHLRPPHSAHTKRKISKVLTGRPVSAETRCKISKSENGKIVSDETKQKSSMSHTGITQSEQTRRRRSATRQGISYDEWETYATDSPYCPKFNEACKESNREKYGRRCFITGKPEADNITTTGKHCKLSVHHVDMNKAQGCDGHAWKLVPLGMDCHGSSHGKVWTARIEYLLDHVWYHDGVWTPDALC